MTLCMQYNEIIVCKQDCAIFEAKTPNEPSWREFRTFISRFIHSIGRSSSSREAPAAGLVG